MLGIFERITDYSKMMMRIMLSTFALSVLALWLLRSRIPELDATLAVHLPTVTVKFFDLPISFGTVLPAAIISVLFRIFRVHDRVSDLVGIRRRFDADRILHPLAVGSLGHVSEQEMRRIKKARHDLMSRVFYRYASSKSPAIDAHFIEDPIGFVFLTPLNRETNGSGEFSFCLPSLTGRALVMGAFTLITCDGSC